MKRILVAVLNYFPGYMSGGVARTIFNTAEWLGDDFDFLILTRDRDLGAHQPYPDIEQGRWYPLGRSKVRYLAPQELSAGRLMDVIRQTPHDVLHLNSDFDPVFTIRLMALRKARRVQTGSILLSPRGEFGEGSLRLKYPKKRAFMELARWTRLYRDVTWHASSPYEAQEMAEALRIPEASIRLAIDLPIRAGGLPSTATASSPAETPSGGPLRVVFLSRISREKNLSGALELLHHVKSPVGFDIVGPKEDARYWAECEEQIRTLPRNVQVRFCGPVAPEQVFQTLSGYDLLLLPTLGENYGHVIAESVSVGTRVLVSQLTPWRGLQADGLGWDLDLQQPRQFAQVIDQVSQESPRQRAEARARAQTAAAARLSDPDALAQNRTLFDRL